MNGTDLLTGFREGRSERAFSELVRRYTNLVYSIAKRRLSNVALAEEVTQIVFIRLAKAAPKVRGDAELVAWLHRTTVHVSIDLWRSETRRRAREEHAVAMQPVSTENPAWNELAPLLDEALNELNDADRQAILLRFFDEKTMRDLGVNFGVSEDAAKMRVSRALERLRNALGARGVSCSAIALGPLLAERAVEAAPSQLVTALAALKVPAAAGLGAAGILSLLQHVSNLKLVAAVAGMVLVGTATFVFIRSQESGQQGSAVETAQAADASAASEQNPAVSDSGIHDTNNTAGEAGDPDPAKLLRAVAQARQKIASGSMGFRLSTDHFEGARKETNDVRLAAVFDGPMLRFESFGREYRYTLPGSEGEEQAAKMKEQGLDREEAVRAGLLQGFEAHYVTAYDGVNLLRYRATDGKPEGTSIDDPSQGSWTVIFDPRSLGLRTHVWMDSTPEKCLAYGAARSITLVGQESLDGVPAWHVQVQSKHDESLDFWIDVARPLRVLKHTNGRDVVVSKYDGGNPIPTEVTTMEYRNGALLFAKRYIQSKAEFNVPVEPASFTLAGLGMPVGTSVADDRIHRQIGYWTGTGLSENLPSKSGEEPQTPPNLAEMLGILEIDPTSHSALEAATWILLNTPDGTEVEKAAEVILRDHIHNPDLGSLAQGMERMRHRCARKLLEAMLENSPNADVQATACFTLATLAKDEAKHGQNKKATAEAEKLFERVITQFSQAGQQGAEWAQRAKPELSELRRLIIGKPAPEIEGENLEGQSMKLSNYRGNVVVLFFWSIHYSEAAEHRKLIERMAGKPFSLIGVNSDQDLTRTKSTVEKYEITWPTIWDGRSGPISTTWNVRGWPTIFVLDPTGVIRYRDVRGRELADAVEALLREQSRRPQVSH